MDLNPHSQNIRLLRGRETGPSVHQLSAKLKKIAAEVGGFGFVANDVRKCRLHDRRRNICSLRCPIAERAAKPMRRDVVAIYRALTRRGNPVIVLSYRHLWETT